METRRIAISEVKPDPNQPRKFFDQKHIEGLAKSLEIEGIINPIEIDQNGMIVTGECRWRAAKLAGWDSVPVIVNEDSLSEYERLRRQMAENLHQSAAGGASPMNAIDVANGYKQMLEVSGKWSGADHPSYEKKSTRELARELGISHVTVVDYLALLDEPAHVVESIKKGIPQSFYKEMRNVPEKYKDGLREAVESNKITSSKEIRGLKRIIREHPDKAEIEFLRLTKQQNEDANRVLNRAIELSLALKRADPYQFSEEDRKMVHSQLNSVTGSVRTFIGKLKGKYKRQLNE